jgi:CIC family chloride channel protein
MAATFGASTRATFTAIVFVFELTLDYQVILPLMLATVIADLVFNALSEHSIMTEKLSRRGLEIGRHFSVDPFTTVAVSAIMTTPVTTSPTPSPSPRSATASSSVDTAPTPCSTPTAISPAS